MRLSAAPLASVQATQTRALVMVVAAARAMTSKAGTAAVSSFFALLLLQAYISSNNGLQLGEFVCSK